MGNRIDLTAAELAALKALIDGDQPPRRMSHKILDRLSAMRLIERREWPDGPRWRTARGDRLVRDGKGPITLTFRIGHYHRNVGKRTDRAAQQMRRGKGTAQRQNPPVMNAHDKDLENLLKAEREAHERYERLRGYPPDEGEGLGFRQEATEAVREFRSKYH